MLRLIFRDNINLNVNGASGDYTSEYATFLSAAPVVSTESFSSYNLHLDHSPPSQEYSFDRFYLIGYVLRVSLFLKLTSDRYPDANGHSEIPLILPRSIFHLMNLLVA